MTVELLVSFTTIQCGECDHFFAVPRHIFERFRRTKETWYCPAGHPRVFLEETNEKRLERQLAAERASHDQTKASRDAADRRAAAARGQATKLRNRVGKGVCPCCTRSFTNLRRHMATKHPEHSTPAEVAAAKAADT